MPIAISNTRSKKIYENIMRLYIYQEKCLIENFHVAVIEILLFNRKKKQHGNSVKIEITSITPVLQAFLDLKKSLAFKMFSTLVLV